MHVNISSSYDFRINEGVRLISYEKNKQKPQIWHNVVISLTTAIETCMDLFIRCPDI